MNDYVWDIETYPNVFVVTFEHVDLPVIWTFEISDRMNQSQQIVDVVGRLRDQGARLVGFNSISFD